MRRLSPVERFKVILVLAALAALCFVAAGGTRSAARAVRPTPQATPTPAQAAATPRPSPSPAQAEAPKVEGCLSCHAGSEPMHNTRGGKLTDDGKDRMSLTCTACHGGNPFVRIDEGARGTLRRGNAEVDQVMRAAH